MSEPTRPLVRYHGGKWRLAPWIISHFPKHRIYTEAFGGGGSVLLRKPRSYAEVYNDLDGEIVNLFRVARDQGEELRRAIELTPFSRDEFRESYTASDDPIEQARRTMVRAGMAVGSTGISSQNRTGFRADVKRRGTHPATDWARLGDNLADVIRRLQGVVIENRNAIDIITGQDGTEVLHYVDPPYVASTRTALHGKGSYKHEMTDEDHRELAQVLHAVKGAVCLSGYDSALYAELYADWDRVEMATTAGSVGGAVKRTEVLWLKGCRHPQGVLL